MNEKAYLAILLIILGSISIAVTIIDYNKINKAEQYSLSENQAIGVATKIGCLRTSYSDKDLINNKLFMERVIGVQTAQLCYLNG